MSTQESQSNLEENQEFQPTKEDIRKIHDEINQIVNQRIEVTTFAFLTFGAVLGWSIPKSSSEGDAGQLCYFISSALLILLFCFFFLTHRLTYMLRIFRTYLNITGHSEWEKHWAKYRELGGHHHGGYMRPLTVIYLVLGFITFWFPFQVTMIMSGNSKSPFQVIVAMFSNTNPTPLWIRAFLLVLFVAYLVFAFGMEWGQWFENEEKITNRWNEIKNKWLHQSKE